MQAFTFGCEHDRRGEQGGKNIINLKISPFLQDENKLSPKDTPG